MDLPGVDRRCKARGTRKNKSKPKGLSYSQALRFITVQSEENWTSLACLKRLPRENNVLQQEYDPLTVSLFLN